MSRLSSSGGISSYQCAGRCESGARCETTAGNVFILGLCTEHMPTLPQVRAELLVSEGRVHPTVVLYLIKRLIMPHKDVIQQAIPDLPAEMRWTVARALKDLECCDHSDFNLGDTATPAPSQLPPSGPSPPLAPSEGSRVRRRLTFDDPWVVTPAHTPVDGSPISSDDVPMPVSNSSTLGSVMSSSLQYGKIQNIMDRRMQRFEYACALMGETARFAEALLAHGPGAQLVQEVTPMTVPNDTSRLRVALTAMWTLAACTGRMAAASDCGAFTRSSVSVSDAGLSYISQKDQQKVTRTRSCRQSQSFVRADTRSSIRTSAGSTTISVIEKRSFTKWIGSCWTGA